MINRTRALVLTLFAAYWVIVVAFYTVFSLTSRTGGVIVDSVSISGHTVKPYPDVWDDDACAAAPPTATGYRARHRATGRGED